MIVIYNLLLLLNEMFIWKVRVACIPMLAVYKHVFNYNFVFPYMQTLSQVLDGIPTYATQLKINVGVHARRGGDGML